MLTERVVGATDGLSGARVSHKHYANPQSQTLCLPGISSGTNDGYRGAGKANESGDVLNNDTQKTQNLGDGIIACETGAIAALNRSGGTLASRDTCGGSKSGTDCESSKSFELHDGLIKLVN